MSNTNFDALKDELDNAGVGTGGRRGWKPRPGENRIRVLPPAKAYLPEPLGAGAVIDRVSINFRSHFISPKKWGADGDVKVFRCPKDLDKGCPACAFRWKHGESADEGVAAVAKEMGNSLRYVLNIVDLDEPEKGVQPFECGPMVWKQLMGYVSKARYGDCLNPGPEGRNFFLTLTPGSESPSGFNQYQVEPDLEKSSVVKTLPDGWWDDLDALEAQLPTEKDEDEIREIVEEAQVNLGMEPESKPAPKKKPAPKIDEPAPDPPEEEAEEEESAAAAAEPPAPVEVTGEDAGDSDGHDPETCDDPDCSDDVCVVNRLFGE